jgi:tetratricopeptide (TPR) repeat protein
MKPESIVFGVAGIFFGLIVGWVIGSQQVGLVRPPLAAAVAAQQATAPASSSAMPAAQPPKALDEAQVQALRTAAERNATDAQPRNQLGNLYFDAERYPDAVTWYQEALKLTPKDANLSTDLGVSYYYLNQPDRALQQFDYSLGIDPKHAKTLLNQGIVRAFGKQDLQGAAAAWQRLIDLAPDSQEAQTARKALDSLKSAHPGLGGSPSGNGSGM